MKAQTKAKATRFTARRQLLAVAIATCFASGVHALPTVPVVVNGSASFATTGSTLNVTNSNGAIINWQSFGIGAGETTRFIQASAASRVLNNVVGVNGVTQMSQIYGTLSSNGQVWLVNPAGIVVGAGGIVDTAGFIASTLKIRPEDFLANQLKFQATPGAGDVINQGTIRTPSGGSVYLVGSNVGNEGLITTPNGETILAAGATVELIDTGTPGVKVAITGSAGNATNLGQIVAEAGRIGIAGGIVRNSGTLDASSVVNEGGRIFLKASQDTYVDGNGRIVATGTRGGQVEVLGNRVAVTDNAGIDASGTNGGGTILVGGDYQGKNPGIQNANVTYFGPDATLKANATDSGDGGKVIVWADDTTRAYGRIEAKGGPNAGNGGFVETSGKKFLEINGIRVMTGNGTWLLDPGSITMTTSYGGATCFDSGGGVFDCTGSVSTVYWGDIASSLSSNYSVDVQTDGDITFEHGTFSLNYLYPGELNLYAGNDILMPSTLGSTTLQLDAAELYMFAGRDIKIGSASHSSTVAATHVYLYSGRDINIDNSSITATGDGSYSGEMSLLAGSNINISNVSQLIASAGSDNQGEISLFSGFSYSGLASVLESSEINSLESLLSLLSNSGATVNIGIDSSVKAEGASGQVGIVTSQLDLSGDSHVIANDTYLYLNSGGVTIDGVQTLTSPGSTGSGFYRDPDFVTPASVGNGLYIINFTGTGSATIGALINEINNSTNIETIQNTSPIGISDPLGNNADDPGGGEGEFGEGENKGKKKARQCRGA